MLDALHVLEGESDVGGVGLLPTQVVGTNLEYIGFPAFGELLTHASGGDESSVGEVQSSDDGENGHLVVLLLLRAAIAQETSTTARTTANWGTR